MDNHQIASFIWQIADLLRGPYRPPQYERVMLPLTVLRRFDCVLELTKQKVLDEYDRRKDKLEGDALDSKLNLVAEQNFHNHSPLNFEKLKGDPDNIDKHLVSYIQGFSKNVREIFERFDFANEIERMREHNILYLIVSKFCEIDLHPNKVDNIAMGSLFENLIRRFNEAANETAGDHFTPREVIHLMVDILFEPDDAILTKPHKIITLLDPTCGTGGLLSEAQNHLHEMNAEAQLYVYGQDFNPRSYAIAASDLLLKKNFSNQRHDSVIRFGDSLVDDQFVGDTFDYFLANPPFGVDWKLQQKRIQAEYQKSGFNGRFGAGLPRVNDGSLLFLQHMLHKFTPIQPEINQDGSRLAIVFNGSPLFTGGAGSGESDIRKWIIENDWLETIIALPEQLFYNTGIGTYIWVVTSRKEVHRRGKVQLIDARERWKPLRRSLGDKRRELGEDDIKAVVCEYSNFVETETSKIFSNSEFGYKRVSIERPLRLLYQMDVERKSRFLDAFPNLLDDVQAIDKKLGREPRADWNEFDTLLNELLKQRGNRWKQAEIKQFREVFTEVNPDSKGVIANERKAKSGPYDRVWGWFKLDSSSCEVMYEPDTQLRDNENVPLQYGDQEINSHQSGEEQHLEIIRYFWREVQPHVTDAWADREKVRSAYEINFSRHFYDFKTPRSLDEIDGDIKRARERVLRLLAEVIE